MMRLTADHPPEPQLLLHALFENVGGALVPRLPIDANGRVRVADGETILNVGQAAGRFGLATSDLIRAYGAFCADVGLAIDDLQHSADRRQRIERVTEIIGDVLEALGTWADQIRRPSTTSELKATPGGLPKEQPE